MLFAFFALSMMAFSMASSAQSAPQPIAPVAPAGYEYKLVKVPEYEGKPLVGKIEISRLLAQGSSSPPSATTMLLFKGLTPDGQLVAVPAAAANDLYTKQTNAITSLWDRIAKLEERLAKVEKNGAGK
jgi:hypothetical protein